jgi:hypothetical protein
VALFSQLIRTAAITGRTDTMNAWFADRQSAQWVERTMAAAVPAVPAAPPRQVRPLADPRATVQTLTELHDRGFVTDAEYERLRARLP